MSAPKGFKFPGRSKIPYRLHNPHYEPNYPKADREITQYLSIDPGVTYLAYRVERRYRNGMIETVIFELVNLTDSDNVYADITKRFDSFEAILIETNVVIVENQMSNNYSKVRISQHILTYFTEKLRNSKHQPPIVEISSKCKSKYLNAPTETTEYQLKKWAIQKAKELLQLRSDQIGLRILESNSRNTKEKVKADDLSDCILMIEAFCVLHGLPLTRSWSPPILEIIGNQVLELEIVK